ETRISEPVYGRAPAARALTTRVVFRAEVLNRRHFFERSLTMAAVPSETTQHVSNPVTVNKATLDFLAGAPKQLLINGKWVPAKSGKVFEAVNPANEEVIARVAEGDKADVEEAVKAARKAFDEGPWPKTSPHQRARYLLKIADLIDQHADEL